MGEYSIEYRGVRIIVQSRDSDQIRFYIPVSSFYSLWSNQWNYGECEQDAKDQVDNMLVSR